MIKWEKVIMRSSCSGNCWGDIDISIFNGQLKSEPVKHCSCLMPVEHLKWDALGGTQCVPAGGFVLATNSGSGTGPRAAGLRSLWGIYWYTGETLPCEDGRHWNRLPRASSLGVSEARLVCYWARSSCGHPQHGCGHMAARAPHGVLWILCHFSHF